MSKDSKPSYVPTPDEIRNACFEIQYGWTKCEERMRRLGRGKTELARNDRVWTPPLVDVDSADDSVHDRWPG